MVCLRGSARKQNFKFGKKLVVDSHKRMRRVAVEAPGPEWIKRLGEIPDIQTDRIQKNRWMASRMIPWLADWF